MRTRTARPLRLAALMIPALACAAEPIVWDDPAYGPAIQPPAEAPCEEPVPAARGVGSYRVWWQPLNRAPMFLLAAQREGAEGVVIDRREVDVSCEQLRRPAAFADSANDYLHVAYYAPLRGAAGVYYAHSMKASRLARRGEGMFEQPVVVVHGDRPSRASVASRGDTVVIAYEDPNSASGAVAFALSTDAGHSFSHRGQVAAGRASRPGVSLRAGEIQVSWVEETRGSRRAVMRRGRFR